MTLIDEAIRNERVYTIGRSSRDDDRVTRTVATEAGAHREVASVPNAATEPKTKRAAEAALYGVEIRGIEP